MLPVSFQAEQLQKKNEEEEKRLAREKAILKAKDREKQRQVIALSSLCEFNMYVYEYKVFVFSWKLRRR